MFIPNTNIDLLMSDKSLQSLLNNKTLEEKAYTIANEYKEFRPNRYFPATFGRNFLLF